MNIITTAEKGNQAFKMTPSEMRLIRAYRKYTDELQDFWLRSLEVSAPNEQPKAHGLRLIAGGAHV